VTNKLTAKKESIFGGGQFLVSPILIDAIALFAMIDLHQDPVIIGWV
jgi:hypothetical protein